MLALGVTLAAGLGAVARYLVDHLVRRPDFPLGTLVVNVTGSFVLGLVGASGPWAAVIGTGFAGGYTTLSTLSWETLGLLEEGAGPRAALNLVATVSLGLLAAAAGVALAA